MKNIFSFLLMLAISFLQAVILKMNFLLLFVLLKRSYFWAFLSGLIFDLLTGNQLGLSSLLFLLILFLFRLYSRKYEPRSLFLFTFVFLVNFFFIKIEGLSWNFWQGILLALIILPFAYRFEKKRQLKLAL